LDQRQIVDGHLLGADVAETAVDLEGELVHLAFRQPLERPLGHDLEPFRDVACVPECRPARYGHQLLAPSSNTPASRIASITNVMCASRSIPIPSAPEVTSE